MIQHNFLERLNWFLHTKVKRIRNTQMKKQSEKKRVKLYQVQKAKSMKSLSDSSRENEHGDGKPCIILVHEIITARNVSLKNSNHI